MKKHSRLSKNLLYLFMAAACGGSFAAAGWTDAGQIAELNQQPATTNSLLLLRINVGYNPTDPGACHERNGFFLAVNDDRKKRIFAMLLSAQMTSRSVRVYVTGNCYIWGQAEIDAVVVN